MKSGKWLAVAVCIALQMGVAFGGGSTPLVKADNKTAFEAVAAEVRQQLQPGGRWQYTSNLEKEQVNRGLDDMQALFEKFDTVQKMDPDTRMRLFNDQEAVNEILTKRDGEHLVCSDEMPTGSHIPKRVCRTYAQMRQDEEDARMWGNTGRPHPCKGGGTGC